MTAWAGRTYKGFPRNVYREAQHTIPKRCAHCGATDVDLELDHIINHAAGGTDTIDNAQWLCGPCHTTKTNRERAAARAARTARGRYDPGTHPGLRPHTPTPPPRR